MRKKQLISAVTLMLSSAIMLNAQDNSVTNSIDTLNSKIEQAESDLTILKKIKFSGYVQAQWQKADTIGTPASASGGDFKGFDNRFQIRRARLKAAYSGENTQVVFQFDLKDDGSVKVKEAYGIYSEPFLKTFSLTAGIFNRPIGYEVEYSSSTLESPERSRIMQTLFPDECDLGAKLTIQAPKTSPLNIIKIDVGLFNGNAIASETDKYKDIIAHLSVKKAALNENLLLQGGVSYYNGGWANPKGNVFKYNSDSVAFILDPSYKNGDKLKRNYFGLDAQATIASTLGLTTIRGEYLWGTQAGTSSASKSPTGAVVGTSDKTTKIVVHDTITNKDVPSTYTVTSPTNFLIRDFSGGYVMFIQRIMQSKHEFVVKYDWYDPNTKAAEDEIGKSTISVNQKLSTGDIKYTTLGLGWNYYITSNLKFAVYYDMVTNEKTSKIKGSGSGLDDYSKDLKDNVLTIRVLYKF
jgi:hypothetical protein